jgi:hypothetical protein
VSTGDLAAQHLARMAARNVVEGHTDGREHVLRLSAADAMPFAPASVGPPTPRAPQAATGTASTTAHGRADTRQTPPPP